MMEPAAPRPPAWPEPVLQPTPTPRRKPIVLLGIFAAFALGLGSGYLLWGVQAGQSNPPQATGEPTRYDVSADDDPSLGPADAPVTIIEFSDYNCPYCRKWHQETFPAIMQQYGDQIRFVYRDLPVVGGGAVGFLAAQAAECAGDQGAFWEFNDALFNAEYGLSRQAYLAYADDLGLDRHALEECLDSGYYEEEVRGDLADAFALGVGSTPTFFIDGIPVVGALSTETFLAIIQSELDR
jgi:protein-disulfide isomerase